MPRKKKAKKPGDPKIAVAYTRVSTDEQKLGPEAQRSSIEAWSSREGVTVARWCTDEGVSGSVNPIARDGFKQAVAAILELQAGVLVIAKRDRLARDALFAGLVERDMALLGARILSADGVGNEFSPEGQLVRGIQDQISQYERELIRLRVRAAMDVKRQRGEYLGSVPFGFVLGEDGIHLVSNEEEQQTILRIQELRAENTTYNRIAAVLAQEGRKCRGKTWHAMTIQRIVHSLTLRGGGGIAGMMMPR